jgi:CheY-like chemotaxis protein
MARILVVDDVRFISTMLAEVLRKQGHQVVTAEDGDQATMLARRERPDLVLLDISIPGPDGLEVARRIKGDDETRHIPIMIVTSHNDRASLECAYAAGADDYVIKPFDTPTLLEKTEVLLGGFRTNFSIDVVRGVPIVTVLRADPEGELVDQLRQALVAARSGPSRPVLVDLTRMPDAEPALVDAIAKFAKSFSEEGGVLGVVIPPQQEGMQRLFALIVRYARVHASREAALKAAGGEESPDASAVLRDPQRGVLVEKAGRTTLFRIRRIDLVSEVFELLAEELDQTTDDVLIEMTGVTGVTPLDVWKLAALAQEVGRGGRAFRLVNPEEPVTELLRSGGLEELVIRSPARDVPPTRASS